MNGARCGCCECAHAVTPVTAANRPGLSAIAIRAGTHATFLESMLAGLSSAAVPSAGALTTRDPSDAAIALLDAWACVADVLTFYEERVANEGYLRTATERRSIVELGRLVGYELRPGVAASVFLAYTIQEPSVIEIPAGAKVQSVPIVPGEKAQMFETSDPLQASWQWNAMRPRLLRHPEITLGNVYTILRIDFTGTATNLKTQDPLLFVFGRDVDEQVLRVVKSVTVDHQAGRTIVTLQPFVPLAAALAALLMNARRKITEDPVVLEWLIAGARWMNVYGGAVSETLVRFRQFELAEGIMSATELPAAQTFAQALGKTTVEQPTPDDHAVSGVAIEDVVKGLTAPLKRQLAGGRQLPRDLAWRKSDDSEPRYQLMRALLPALRTFEGALGATLFAPAEQTLPGVFVLRDIAALFGNSASANIANADGNPVPRTDVDDEDTDGRHLDLDRVYDKIAPQSWVVIRPPILLLVKQMSADLKKVLMAGTSSKRPFFGAKPLLAQSVETIVRNGYEMSGKVTRLTVEDGAPWWQEPESSTAKSPTLSLTHVRNSSVLVQAEALELAEVIVDDDVRGDEIELDGYYPDLRSGQWMVLTGERTDIPNTAGVIDREVAMIAGVDQIAGPGDTKHTMLHLAIGLAHSYERSTVVINANVVKATHGETHEEVVGSGDASKSMQRMTLKIAPLTFVSAPTPSGVASTLEVRVNRVRWDETESLSGLDPQAHAYLTQISDDGQTTMIFPDGVEGSRLPTGSENVTAKYRSGLGRAGNLKASQLIQAITRPIGTKEVDNPLPASGGADPETRDQARRNIPVALLALDRLVSVQDYADFSRTFAGIAKARAALLPGSGHSIVHVTIAGDGDAEIDVSSDLYTNLLDALQTYGDPAQRVVVAARERVVVLLRANVRIDRHYLWDDVEPAIRAALVGQFGFESRQLGQNLYESEIVAAIQNVPGVDYVDVDDLTSIAAADVVPKKKTLKKLPVTEQPVLPGMLEERLGAKLERLRTTLPMRFRSVRARPAYRDSAGEHPAQLAYVTPEVPDTVVLQEIKE